MSFGPSKETQQAQQSLAQTNQAAQANSAAQLALANRVLNLGTPSVNAGTNFFQTLLHGNQANTTAMLQPSINQIRAGAANTNTAINTLMPRGGGRSSTLFGAAYAPSSQISNLFNTGRVTGAQTLPQIGLQTMGLGTNLFGIGNQPLNTAVSGATSAADIAQRQQQMGLNFWSGLGSGLLGLATTPIGGGAATNGLLGML